MREEVIKEVFAYLEDHYWDSLEDDRAMLMLHLEACKARLLHEKEKDHGLASA